MSTALQADGAPTLEAIFREHAPYVWRALRRLGVHERDVEDLCQDVFLVVHRRLDSFHGGSSVRTWLYGICIRAASDYRKRRHRHHEAPAGDDLPDVSAPPELEEAVERRQACDRLDEALELLDDVKRAVFVLYELEGVLMPEVAEAVGCPLQTAYSRLYAARKIVTETLLRNEALARSQSEALSRCHGEGMARSPTEELPGGPSEALARSQSEALARNPSEALARSGAGHRRRSGA